MLSKALTLVVDTDVVTISYIYNNIGFAYMSTDNKNDALMFFNRAVEIREKNLGTEHPDTIESYINIGYLYEKMGDNEKSLLYYKKVLNISPELIKPIHQIIRCSYNWNHFLSNLDKDIKFTYLKKNWR